MSGYLEHLEDLADLPEDRISRPGGRRLRGRPPQKGGAMQVVAVRLPRKMIDKLDVLAQERGTSVTTEVRRCVEAQLWPELAEARAKLAEMIEKTK